jgi:hypothetical protein
LPSLETREAELLDQLGSGGRRWEVRPHELEDLFDPEAARKARLLRRRADRGPADGVTRVAAEEQGFAAIGPAEAEEDANGGRLACAIRPEQDEHLARR